MIDAKNSFEKKLFFIMHLVCHFQIIIIHILYITKFIKNNRFFNNRDTEFFLLIYIDK